MSGTLLREINLSQNMKGKATEWLDNTLEYCTATYKPNIIKLKADQVSITSKQFDLAKSKKEY